MPYGARMTHRSFRDHNGVVWETWDVVPYRAERRLGDPREMPGRPTRVIRDGSSGMLERRRRGDRRAAADPEPRVRVSPGLEQGWLVFESRAERRRLAPIPGGWERLTDRELEALCRRAATLPARRRLAE